jgi:hypothetical protein
MDASERHGCQGSELPSFRHDAEREQAGHQDPFNFLEFKSREMEFAAAAGGVVNESSHELHGNHPL